MTGDGQAMAAAVDLCGISHQTRGRAKGSRDLLAGPVSSMRSEPVKPGRTAAAIAMENRLEMSLMQTSDGERKRGGLAQPASSTYPQLRATAFSYPQLSRRSVLNL